jgi:hypothetical protein
MQQGFILFNMITQIKYDSSFIQTVTVGAVVSTAHFP